MIYLVSGEGLDVLKCRQIDRIRMQIFAYITTINDWFREYLEKLTKIRRTNGIANANINALSYENQQLKNKVYVIKIFLKYSIDTYYLLK